MRKGFTLIELLVVIGIIVVLMGVVIVAVNPVRQFAQANNSRRRSNVVTILNAVSQNIIENGGKWSCSAGDLPTTTPKNMADPTSDPQGYDICSCLVPRYLPEIPVDPTAGSYTDCSNYNSGYTIIQDPTTGRVTVSAPHAQSEDGAPPVISVTQ